MAKNNKPGKKTLIRIIALVLCVLLAGSAIYASIVSVAYADTSVSAMYDSGNAALAAFQTTEYTNDTGERLRNLPFALYANQLRRNDALPAGPGGVEIYSVTVDGENAPWSVSLDECELFVSCDIAPGAKAQIAFEYSVILPESKTFSGTGDMGARLSFFYPALLLYQNGEFAYREMSPVAVPMFFPQDDYVLTVSLPDGYIAVAGVEPMITAGEGGSVYEFKLSGARDASIAIGRRYTKYASGCAVAYANNASAAKKCLDAANYAVQLFGDWLDGDISRVEIVQVDQDEPITAHCGVIWLSSEQIVKGDIEKDVVLGVAKQYFSQSLLADPEYEPWLNEALGAYMTCLYYFERYGRARFEEVLNAFALDSLKSTIPGALTVDSDLSIFNTRAEYEAVVIGRGVAAINEVRHALGFDEFREALKIYYAARRHSTASISDFAAALNQAHGSPVDYLLMESLTNISQYINQSPERLD